MNQDPEGSLLIGGVSVKNLAAQFGTPLYVYDEARIRDNARRVRHAFASRYPDLKLYYAIKANSNPAIAHILRQEGIGMDTASLNEVQLAQSLGLQGEDIIFSGNFLSDADLKQGLASGVIFNLDDITLLPRLLQFGTPSIISFRINPGIGKSNVGHFDVTGGPEAKFGLHPDQVLAAYKAAQSAGIKRFGVHMMAGSCVTDPAYFSEITGRLFDIIGRVHNELGIEFEFIDLGGGLGVPYRPHEEPLDLEATAEGVVNMFRQKTTEYGLKPPRLVMEPGRYFVADAGHLIGKVHAKKEGYQTIVGCDLGMNIIPRIILYNAYHHIRVDGKDGLPTQKTNLTGQICEQTDLWGKGLDLPLLEIGDLLVMENMGAYCFGMSYRYNGRLLLAEVLVHDGKVTLIREAETLEDALRNTRIPGHLTTHDSVSQQ